MREIDPTMLILGALGLWVLMQNLRAYRAFSDDKRRAVAGAQRVPEGRLLWLAMTGGWPAAKLAQHLLRHKTRKQPFARQLNLSAVVPVLMVALAGMAVVSLPSRPIVLDEVFQRGMQAVGAAFTSEHETAEPVMPRRFGPGS